MLGSERRFVKNLATFLRSIFLIFSQECLCEIRGYLELLGLPRGSSNDEHRTSVLIVWYEYFQVQRTNFFQKSIRENCQNLGVEL